jgi:hypothetical protein
MRRRWSFVCLLATALPIWAADPAEVKDALAKLRAVGREGSGHDAARMAWKQIAAQGPETLPTILAGLDDASPMAANWIRSAYESVLDRSLKAGPIPAAPFEKFVEDTSHSGIGRRLAYETLVRLDPKTPERWLPKLLDDPGSELRRDAVDVLLKKGQAEFDAKDTKTALGTYKDALGHAREQDQVKLIADRLKALGEPVDLVKHFGFVTRWQLVGPFNNHELVGYAAKYPPEDGFDEKTSYVGKEDAKVGWKEYVCDQPLGLVDFNKILGPLHGTVAYSHAVVESPVERPVEVRCGSNNAIVVFLNGRRIYGREEYHHGMQMDQHVGRGTLKAGRNEVLVKVLQNEQTDSWAQQWSMQVRLCDALGGAVPFQQP